MMQWLLNQILEKVKSCLLNKLLPKYGDFLCVAKPALIKPAKLFVLGGLLLPLMRQAGWDVTGHVCQRENQEMTFTQN